MNQSVSTIVPCRDRYHIGKVGISAVDMDKAIETLDLQARSGTSAYVCVANVRTVVLAQRDADYCRIQNQSLLSVPDGMPLVWAARIAGAAGVSRVTGPDLMLRVLGLSARRGYSHFFYGDTEQTLHEMDRVIRNRFGGARIKGYVSPPFGPVTPQQTAQAAEEINRLKPTFVWVALGAPRQDWWMARVVPQLDSAILVGVGAAFRFLIGQYTHPPSLVQKLGLEGVCWRFMSNPGREALWYCKHVPLYGALLVKVLANRLCGRRA